MAEAGQVGKTSMWTAINADFRTEPPSFATKRHGAACTTFEGAGSAAVFVKALEAEVASGHQLVTFNGTSYIFGRLLGVLDEEHHGCARTLARNAVDVMVAFFVDNGFTTQRRMVGIRRLGNLVFLSGLSKKLDHQSVTSEVLELAATFDADSMLMWMPKKWAAAGKKVHPKRGAAKGSGGPLERGRAWVPSSAPHLMTVAECEAFWNTATVKPGSTFLASQLKFKGDIVPAPLCGP